MSGANTLTLGQGATEHAVGPGTAAARSLPAFALMVLVAVAPSRSQTAASVPITRLPLAEDSCPTLRWTAVEGASGYELALFALPFGHEPSLSSELREAVLKVIVTSGPTAWRPTPAWCPRERERYAWSVRALAEESLATPGRTSLTISSALRPMGDWSVPRVVVGARESEEQRLRRELANVQELLEAPEARAELRELLDSSPAPRGAKERAARVTSPLPRRPEVRLRPSAAANAGGPVTIGPHYLGTTAAQDFELRLDGSRALLVRPTSSTPNLIAGHADNFVADGVVGATIAGGGQAGEENAVTDDYGTIGGGRGNTAGDGDMNPGDAGFATVGGGRLNEATGPGATVGGGMMNLAAGSRSTVAGGLQNQAATSFATVGGGALNNASSERSTIPGGLGAKTRRDGQLAYAAGGFGGELLPGDAQWSLYVLLAETTDATPTELLLSGAFPLQIESGQTVAFRTHVSAVNAATGEESAGYLIEGLIENDSGTTALVGTPTVTVLGEDVSSWGVTVSADDANDALRFVAVGAAGTSIRWVATVRAAEVMIF